jgi:glutathione S-transferase
MAPHIVLHELGVQHEAIKMNMQAGDTQKPEFLKLNPRGQVPLLIDEDGTPIKEGAAIMIYLMDKHKSPLLPQTGKARAKALEWLCWGNATLHPAYGRAFWAKYRIQDEAVKAFVQKEAFAQIQTLWDEAEAQLGKTKYLAGDQVTAADILVSVIANWDVGKSFTMGPNLKRMIAEISKRPAFQKAIQHEQVEYKAAA